MSRNMLISNGFLQNTANRTTKILIVESSVADMLVNSVLVLSTLLYVWDFS